MKKKWQNVYEGLTVLVTGHTGFKGSWLTLWLRELGAHVIGYSLPPSTIPNNFELTQLTDKVTSLTGDIRDKKALQQVFETYQPQIIFHLAAQPIVLQSFTDPQETFETNVMGTINVLEAIKQSPSVKAAVMITSDKCYENKEWIWGYREHDLLGGSDPYSASKAMAELAISSYRKSFFSFSPAVASVRAGNVIGGGDFSKFRLVPDGIKALLENRPIVVRNPQSVRPWLHVLEPLCGYLMLGAHLLQQGQHYAEAWNFGPLEQEAITAQALIEKMIEFWGGGDWINPSADKPYSEMGLLRLNWDKAANILKWRPQYSWEEAIKITVEWFKDLQENKQMEEVCLEQIRQYSRKNAEVALR